MRTLRGLGLAGVVLPMLAMAASGQSRARVVTISYMAKQVQVTHARSSDQNSPLQWTTALLNAPVIEGESIRTGAGSDAEVELECGSALRLAPDSEMKFNLLRLRKDGVRITKVMLQHGEAYFTIQNADSRGFHAQVATGVISMPDGGPELRLDAGKGSAASVDVLDGEVLAKAESKSAMVHSPRRVEWMPGGAFQVVTTMSKPDKWQKWSHRRDVAFQRAIMLRGPLIPEEPDVDAPGVPALPPAVMVPEVSGQAVRLRNLQGDSEDPRRGPTPPPPHCAHRG